MDATDFMPDAVALARIRAEIDRYEAERLAASRQVRWWLPVYIALLLAMVAVVAWGFNAIADPYEQWISPPHVFLYCGALIACFFLYRTASRPARNLQKSFRQRLIPAIFSFIQDVRYQNGEEPASFDRLPPETIGSFNRQRFDDVISGTYQGFAFELYEAQFSHNAGTSAGPRFKGIVLAFAAETPFPGLLIAARKNSRIPGLFGGMFGGASLTDLQSGVAALDEIYDFRTDNAEAAQPLVTGRLAQALQWLRETWPKEPARIALRGGDSFLLLPQTRDFFELPTLDVAIDYKAVVEPMISDMAALLATASLVRKIGAADVPRSDA